MRNVKSSHFIYLTNIEHLMCVQHYIRYWKYNSVNFYILKWSVYIIKHAWSSQLHTKMYVKVYSFIKVICMLASTPGISYSIGLG